MGSPRKGWLATEKGFAPIRVDAPEHEKNLGVLAAIGEHVSEVDDAVSAVVGRELRLEVVVGLGRTTRRIHNDRGLLVVNLEDDILGLFRHLHLVECDLALVRNADARLQHRKQDRSHAQVSCTARLAAHVKSASFVSGLEAVNA